MSDGVNVDELDSIDALLDEAEFDEPSDVEPESVAIDEPEEDLLDALSEGAAEEGLPDEANDLLDELGDDLSHDEPEPEAKTETISPISDNKQSEEFLQKRAVAEPAVQKNQLTVAEMDAIKKLIIILGSVIITLALIGIGIGLWAALKGAPGLDEESMAIIEHIKSGTEQNTIKGEELNKSIKMVEKKLDALSFQLEQLNSDLADLSSQKATMAPTSPAATPVINLSSETAHMPAANHSTHNTHNTHNSAGHGSVRGHTTHEAPVHSVAPVLPAPVPAASTTSVEVKMSAEVGHKLSQVNAAIVRTQRRIKEVNRRVRSLQSQYGRLLNTMKSLEKRVIKGVLTAQKQHEVVVKPAAQAPVVENKTETQPKSYGYQAPENRYAW